MDNFIPDQVQPAYPDGPLAAHYRSLDRDPPSLRVEDLPSILVIPRHLRGLLISPVT